MNENYIKYWGLERHPFLLAPDSSMMYTAGQYYECLERLKYAVDTNKGGVLIVSEDAGLGKTTTLLKLIDEMKDLYGSAFKYAFVDHPTLTSEQMIAYIAGCFIDSTPYEDNRSKQMTIDYFQNRMQVAPDFIQGHDKLKNLRILKEALIDVKQQGGKSIIIVDEGQMLCGAREILQELRVLINLTHENEYLHTFILSGQRPLWNEVKSIPEFWQRLPVRYYFVPLKLKETRNLIKYRLMKAGLNDDREIFTSDAIYIIQKYSMGSPRTIIALADLALLIGYSDRSTQIGFKEISKVINAMSGKGESLQYIREEKTKRDGDHVFTEEGDERIDGDEGTGKKDNKVKEKSLDGDDRERTVKDKEPDRNEQKRIEEDEQEGEERGKREELYEVDQENIDKEKEKEERKDRYPEFDNIAGLTERKEIVASKLSDFTINLKGDSKEETKKPLVRPFFIILAFIFSVIAAAAAGYYFAFSEKEMSNTMPVKKEITDEARDKILQEARVMEAQKPEEVKPEGYKPDDTTPESIKQELVKPEAITPEVIKPEAQKPEIIRRREDVKPEVKKPEMKKTEVKKVEARKAVDKKPDEKKPEDVKREAAKSEAAKPEETKKEAARQEATKLHETGQEATKPEETRQEGTAQSKSPVKSKKEALIIATGANVRNAPDINAARIALIFKGEKVKIIDEKTDAEGKTWYKFQMYGSRDGWISEDAISIRSVK